MKLLLKNASSIVESYDMTLSYNFKLRGLLDHFAPLKARIVTSNPSAL